jgi:hypothetical protein
MDMNTPNITSPPADHLPIKRKLTLAYILSPVIALVMTVVSVVGLLYHTSLYPDEMRLAFTGQDAINLVFGVPLLLVSLWLARRGKLIGLLFLPGALFSVSCTSLPPI